MDKLQEELKSFSTLWEGGFKNVIENTDNRRLADVFDYCLKQNMDGKVILEIGPGGGSWTKLMTPAKKIYCLDALSAEHNGFWQYVGEDERIEYHQVEDFSLKEVPDKAIDLVYSYDAFCHISWTGVKTYMTNLLAKLKPGAQGFIMIPDLEKCKPAMTRSFEGEDPDDFDGLPSPGRWYWWGLARYVALLRELGYVIVKEDIGLDARDPIVHFKCPENR